MKLLHRKRKFVIAATALVFTFILALLDVVSGSNWVAATSTIVGLYGGAEAAEGFAHARFNQQEPANGET